MSGSPAPPTATLEQLSGWGRTAPAMTLVDRIATSGSLESLFRTQQSGLIARGLGRSYGDAAQCSGGLTVDATGLGRIGDIDPVTETVSVGGGVSLHRLIRHVVPAGWFVPVTPGTRYVSVGGAIAADVHGKNHHQDGSFARHVTELTLATPTGTYTVSAAHDPDLFWATAGGMGLTGIVVSATLRLRKIETSWIRAFSQRFARLEELMVAMEETDARHRYSVAWLDCTRRIGDDVRSVLTWGDHAPSDALPPCLQSRRLEAPKDPKLAFHRPPPVRMVNRLTAQVLNEGWFRASSAKQERIQPIGAFLHPLDGVAGWNVLYGPSGFVQYQFVVAAERGDVLEWAVGSILESRVPSFLAVLKRFGPGTPGPLSFAQAGWTLALDFPVGPPALPALLDRLDERIAAAGGRVYLAKDSRLRPDVFRTMYPRAEDFAAVRRRVDPEGRITSDLERRLDIPR